MLKSLANLVAAAALAITAGPALAQIQTIDPNQADTYQAPVDPYQAPAEPDAEQPAWDDSGYETPAADDPVESSEWPATDQTDDSAIETSEAPAAASPTASATVPREDVFSAAEGVFGRGAEGLLVWSCAVEPACFQINLIIFANGLLPESSVVETGAWSQIRPL